MSAHKAAAMREIIDRDAATVTWISHQFYMPAVLGRNVHAAAHVPIQSWMPCGAAVVNQYTDKSTLAHT